MSDSHPFHNEGVPPETSGERLKSPRRYLWYASVPVLLAVVSWFLGGNLVWAWIAGIAALVLIVIILGGLRVLAQRDLQAGDFLAAGYLFLCWGSWTAVGYFLPLTTIQVKADALNPMEDEPTCPLRVIYDGEVRAEVARGPECSCQIRGRVQRDRLKVETLTPLGWVGRPFRNYGGDVELEKIPTTFIYLDNRSQKEVKLVCGQLGLDGPPDSKERFRIPALPQGVSCPLTLDGKVIGAIEDQNVLVDTLGTRSYRVRTLTYIGGLEMAMRLTDPARNDPIKEATFRQGHVHKLPGRIDFFLEPAPERIQVTTFGVPGLGKKTRTELTEEP